MPIRMVWANISPDELTNKSVILPAGTEIEMDLSTPVHSKRNKIGDMLILYVTDDVLIEGIVVIKRGERALAYVTDVKRAGPWGKGGAIQIKAECTWSVTDVKIPIAFDFTQQGDGHHMLVPVILGGVFAGYITGEHVSIAPGTKFCAKVVNDITLDISPQVLHEP